MNRQCAILITALVGHWITNTASAQSFANAILVDQPHQHLRAGYDYPTGYIYNELWFRADTFPTRSMISCSAYGAGAPEQRDHQYDLTITADSSISFGVRATDPTTYWMYLTSNTQVLPGHWYHVSVAWSDYDKFEIWLNGQLDAEDNGHSYGIMSKNTLVPPMLTIGTDLEDGVDSTNFHGAIDEVRIWNGYRDSIAINTWKNDTLPPAIYQDAGSGLAGYWRLDQYEDLGVNADGPDDFRDLSPNALHLDAVASPSLIPSVIPASIPAISGDGRSQIHVFPNPFRDDAYVQFSLTRSAPVTYTVFDATGRRMVEKDLGQLGIGTHQVLLDLHGLKAGTYLYQFGIGGSFQRGSIIKSAD